MLIERINALTGEREIVEVPDMPVEPQGADPADEQPPE